MERTTKTRTRYTYPDPLTIRVHFVEGCCLNCWFCGIKSIRKGPGDYKFIELSTVETVAKQVKKLGWRSKFEFAGFGEPTLHPELPEIIRTFKKILPNNQTMVTTNGAGLVNDPTSKIETLMDNGLNILAIDNYAHSKMVPKILKNYKGKYTLRHYPEDRSAQVNKKYGPDHKMVVVIKSIDMIKKGTRILHNVAGFGMPPNEKAKGRRCARPFREINVTYSGEVILCCIDWRASYPCGNIMEKNIGSIWQGEELHAARQFLYQGKRVFPPCKGCSSISYRTGLLPDRMGKDSLEPPDTLSREIVEKVIKRGPLTTPVELEWEDSLCKTFDEHGHIGGIDRFITKGHTK